MEIKAILFERAGALMKGRRLRFAFLFFALLLAFIFAAPAKPLLLNRSGFSQVVRGADGELLRFTLSSDEKYRAWTPLKEIPPHLAAATLLYEDRHFYRHFGVNPWALIRGFFQSYIRKGYRTGGSTLTMQLARLRFGINSSTPWGKLQQILRALQLELYYSKAEILEAYLNSAPYGQNIEGAAAASLIYFGHPVSNLTLPESLTLAVVPQNPGKRAPFRESPAMLRARGRLASAWISGNPGAEKSLQSELALPFSAGKRQQLPYLAPHLVNRLLAENSDSKEIHAALDLKSQRLVEEKISAYVQRNEKFGVENAAALLVDSRSMKVLAYAGSADFFNAAIQGQVDGVRARRSPGSALKPFLYGLAVDQGLIHSKSVLKDTRTSYASYNPENFDGEFLGPVKAGEALIKSRNLPAIELANSLSGGGMYTLLKRAGVAELKGEDFYGLSLVLGGVEVTMEEVASLYAMLANGGLFQRLRYQRAGKAAAGTRLMTPEAAFIVLQMLRENPRPTADFGMVTGAGRRPVAWKTGTSYGFRDAWSVAVAGPYVLAVWIGNFSGQGNPAFVGRQTAAYLLFEILDALPQAGDAYPGFDQGRLNVKNIKVCALSGELPGPHCKHQEEAWFIPGKSPIGVCRIHREVAIDERTGLRLCGAQAGVAGVRNEVYEFWPSELLKLFRLAGLPRRSPPAFAKDCPQAALHGLRPEIASPQKAISYSIRAERVGEETIPFKASADADAGWLYWFLDERLLAKAAPQETFFWTAAPGKYTVRAVDDLGRSDARELEVVVVE